MAILDAYGNPINKSELQEEQATPSLSGVRSIDSDHPSVKLTPSKLYELLLSAEQGDATAYLELAEDMEEKDLHYRAVLQTRKLAVSQLDVIIEPASDSKEDVRNAELLKEFTARETFEDELFDILDAIGKGFSVTEIIWDRKPNLWMPKKLEYRDPRWFNFSQEDGKTLYLKTDDGENKELSPYKFITFFAKTKSGLPIRGGIARAAAWAYLFKNFSLKSWVTFTEVYGQPFRVGKYHSSATETDKRKLLRAVANIGSDAAAIIPESMMIEFVKAEQSGSSDLYEKLSNFLDHQVSKAVLGQTTTTDAISGGHAVSKEHDKVRGDIERADSKQLGATLKDQLFIPMINLNYGEQKQYPKVRLERKEQEDLNKRAIRDKNIMTLGFKPTKKYIEETYGGEWEEATKPEEKTRLTEKTKTSLNRAGMGFDDEVDILVEEEMAHWQEVSEPIIKPILDMAKEYENKGKSLEDFKADLPKLLASMDSLKLHNSLAQSSMAAKLKAEQE